jgi:hypothetical protein
MPRLLFSVLLLLSQLAHSQVTIKHVIFIVKENRSFDSYFNCFPGTGSCLTTIPCFGTAGGCVANAACTNQSGRCVPVIAGDPNVGQADCGHLHGNFLNDFDHGAMDKFNSGCAGGMDYAVQFNATSLPHYWHYASTYGLGAIQASAMAPTFPSHLIMFAGTSGETRDNPSQLIAGKKPNGKNGVVWNLDTFHYGRCAGGPKVNELCSIVTDCPGSTCQIDSSVGKCCTQGQPCDFTAGLGVTCAKNADCSPTQFCSNGNTYGKIGGAAGGNSTYYSIDLAGSAGAPGGNTGYGMFPGTCAAHRTTACVRICPAGRLPDECNLDLSNDDLACTSTGDFCDAGQTTTPAILSSSRGSVGPNITTIGDLLDQHRVTWAYYIPASEYLRNPVSYIPHLWYGPDRKKVFTDTQFAIDVAKCTSDKSCPLASVIWLSAGSIYNEHPPAPVAPGETWTANQVSAVMNNPYLWNNTVMFITWDDFGGFYDHVAPIVDNQGWRNGFRVPVICVGKYCKPGFSNTSFVFESMLKCVENAYRLGPLPGGLFDATANDLCTGCVAGAGCNGHSNNGMIDLTLDNPPSL